MIVGVNRYQQADEGEVELLRIDLALEEKQIGRVRSVRERRDGAAADAALARLREGAVGEANLMPLIVDCAKAGVTMGEMCDALREIWGVWRETLFLSRVNPRAASRGQTLEGGRAVTKLHRLSHAAEFGEEAALPWMNATSAACRGSRRLVSRHYQRDQCQRDLLRRCRPQTLAPASRAVVHSFRWQCHAYCLLSTHYHLAIRIEAPTLASGMQYSMAAMPNCSTSDTSGAGMSFGRATTPV